MAQNNEQQIQAQILKTIFDDKYLVERVHKELRIDKQVIRAWVYTLKHVPLTKVGGVARVLNISPYLLNYKQTCSFYGDRPDLRDIIRDTALFSEVEKDRLLNQFKGAK